MSIEKLKFRLELYSTRWDKTPRAEILINSHSHFNQEITGTEKEPTVIEFEHELTEGEKYSLIIERAGKDNRQTVVENGQIVKDQLLHIKSIEIDEIEIGALVYSGLYTPQYPKQWLEQQAALGNVLPESFKNVTAMGYNGRWELGFTSPFYMWLLENLY
jgi:hypothetical protein